MTTVAHKSAHVFECHLEQFQSEVIEASHRQPVLVDFWADWCSPCHALAPHLERAVEDLAGAVRLAKVEVDEGENMKLAGHYRVRGFPSVLLFNGGEERARFSGSRATHWLKDWIQEHLAHEVLPAGR